MPLEDVTIESILAPYNSFYVGSDGQPVHRQDNWSEFDKVVNAAMLVSADYFPGPAGWAVDDYACAGAMVMFFEALRELSRDRLLYSQETTDMLDKIQASLKKLASHQY